MRLLDKPESEWLAEVRDFATEAMMAMIREDLALLGVRMDHFFSEKSLYGTGQIEAALASLEAKGLLYEGVLEPPKGKLPEDWEPREQTLFRSTAYGDDTDRPVKKSDGGWTYFAPDIAYHYDKIERGFDELIDVLGADHGGYVKRMKAAVAALSDGRVPLDVKLCQLVRLFKGGEPFKMSKRAGTFVTLRDVVEQVGAGRDALRDADAQERRAARLRLRQGAGAVEGQPGLLRAVRPRPGAVGAGARRRGGVRDRRRRAGRGRPRRARRAGRARAGAEDRRVAAAGGDRRARRTSRTGSPSISMISRRNFMRCSIRASSTPSSRFIREDAPGRHPGAAGAGARDAGRHRGRARHPRGDADERDALSRGGLVPEGFSALPVVFPTGPAILAAPRKGEMRETHPLTFRGWSSGTYRI